MTKKLPTREETIGTVIYTPLFKMTNNAWEALKKIKAPSHYAP